VTTLLQEFEEWLKGYVNGGACCEITIRDAQKKLEELKKKHGISKPST